MKVFYLFIFLIPFLQCTAQQPQPAKKVNTDSPPRQKVTKIAFGSCMHQDKPAPVLLTADSLKPDLFVFLGDNIYGDSPFMWVLKRKYKKLAAKPEFKQLKSHVPLLAVWDDHDYGKNDAGREYRQKDRSKKIFLKFWEEPKESKRWERQGIYTSYTCKTAGNKTLQLILLDNRWFRTPLKKADLTNGMDKNDYAPDYNPGSSMLGSKQWKWLETQLRTPADIRIIASSTQFSTEYNGYETWSNFPYEQGRMFDLIERTKANGVVFISGDVHYAELNAIVPENMYPIYDLTASGITEKWDHVEPSRFRIGEAFQENHFGMIEIREDYETKEIYLWLTIYDVNRNTPIQHNIRLNDLQIPD